MGVLKSSKFLIALIARTLRVPEPIRIFRFDGDVFTKISSEYQMDFMQTAGNSREFVIFRAQIRVYKIL